MVKVELFAHVSNWRMRCTHTVSIAMNKTGVLLNMAIAIHSFRRGENVAPFDQSFAMGEETARGRRSCGE